MQKAKIKHKKYREELDFNGCNECSSQRTNVKIARRTKMTMTLAFCGQNKFSRQEHTPKYQSEEINIPDCNKFSCQRSNVEKPSRTKTTIRLSWPQTNSAVKDEMLKYRSEELNL